MRYLEGHKVTKFFGGLTALNKVTFHVEKGEILGLIGPNGSGKTTLINVISCFLPISSGEIYFKGDPLNGLPPYKVGRRGIARTFQVVKPFRNMIVKENVAIGVLYGKRATGRSIGLTEAIRKANEILEFIGLGPKRDFSCEQLTIADRNRLELGKALGMQPELLLLDECMAGLNAREIEEMMELILKIRSQMDITLMVIEHVMKAIMGISDRIFVLHHGEKIAEGIPSEISKNEAVIKAYLGERYAKRSL